LTAASSSQKKNAAYRLLHSKMEAADPLPIAGVQRVVDMNANAR
jgi:hypothetical protein